MKLTFMPSEMCADRQTASGIKGRKKKYPPEVFIISPEGMYMLTEFYLSVWLDIIQDKYIRKVPSGSLKGIRVLLQAR